VLRTLSGLEIKRAFGYGPEMLHVVKEMIRNHLDAFAASLLQVQMPINIQLESFSFLIT